LKFKSNFEGESVFASQVNMTNVCIIVDRSGSMRTFEERNPSVKILEAMTSDCPDAFVTIYAFNEKVHEIVEHMPISDVLTDEVVDKIHKKTEPSGMTALFSAILRLKRLDLKDKDQVIVITDGQNNVNGGLKSECLVYLSNLKKKGVDVEFVGVNGLDIQESCSSYGISDRVLSSELQRGDVLRGLVVLGKTASRRLVR
jgi:hypothetical protein